MDHQLRIKENDRFPTQATSMSHLSNVNRLIKDKLTVDQLDMFRRRTIFGRFVDLEMMFCSGVVHHFLSREVAGSSDDSVKLLIGGNVFTFSKDQFMLITGLWRLPGKVVQKKIGKNRLRRKYFNDEASMMLEEFVEVYKQTDFEDDEDAVKVTLILYTELVMMGKSKSKSKVDIDLYNQVDDLDYFNHLD
ncbi:uncharacterized protein LOC111015183 [Momordica charantia]|uniref:Uncharacterized protein LOC111015183 n=1 Tax=Momordica charantia TaxID=3673 RepID=A0A6J1CX02_MOMCH|nr:uncharacterized protein LOC111015183 [Momordica charantia]